MQYKSSQRGGGDKKLGHKLKQHKVQMNSRKDTAKITQIKTGEQVYEKLESFKYLGRILVVWRT